MTHLTNQERDALFETAEKAARLGGGILRENFGRAKKIMYKGRINPVTNVDLQSEKAIVETIRARYPGHDIITEESDFESTGSPFRWIIDPLDGTVNYAHDYPFTGLSIALEIDGVMEIGVVYNPIMEEYFTARRGLGAFFNGSRIAVSEIGTLEKSLLATGFSYDIRENPYNNLAHFNRLIMRAQALRRDGSAALNLCYTAMGRFDGYWEIIIHPWDIAAGSLIVEEAGGKVTDLGGNALSIYKNEIVSSNGRIHGELLEELQAVNREVYGR